MDSPEEWSDLLRALIYPVQFEANPVDGVDRVLQVVVHARALDATPEEYLLAVKHGLASNGALAELIPQPHAEGVIRRYLAEVARRLSAQLPLGSSEQRPS